ncbi:hypothetical protein [Halorubrum lipolyticum]|uniref:Uncharacterized protein n=1 Tax=Halorubrum lipolyticum DSM 21995 TaxID=1227482 RepID=M0P556_9EURY|nr:hypothetical protein [Halorubrum lipolyticum]EMA64664.1 hypothetical protein C469_00370 [Halorubrum lipolyticum DSM 21995]
MPTSPTDRQDNPDGGYTLPETLTRFAKSPQGFILGAILSPLLEGLNDAVVQLLDLITFVFVGDGPGLVGTLGIADIPLFMGGLVIDIGSRIGGSAVEGTGLLGIVDRLVQAGVDVATIGGPLAPIILAGETVFVVWVLAVLARRTILVIADAVPGLAGVIGT